MQCLICLKCYPSAKVKCAEVVPVMIVYFTPFFLIVSETSRNLRNATPGGWTGSKYYHKDDLNQDNSLWLGPNGDSFW